VSEEEAPVELHRADAETERLQVARVAKHRRARDDQACKDALEALRTACAGTDNTMPFLIEAARRGATMGEMCDVFRDVWGRYRDPARW
jgi:methylmalonyl-CoA mutase N-terminal domain/subunit